MISRKSGTIVSDDFDYEEAVYRLNCILGSTKDISNVLSDVVMTYSQYSLVYNLLKSINVCIDSIGDVIADSIST